VIDEGDDEDEVEYEEGLPVEHLQVEGLVEEVEPETQEGRIEEAVDLGLSLEGGVLVLQLEQVSEVQTRARGRRGLLLFRTLQR